MSASAETFGIAELVEKILEDVPPRDVLVLRRVNGAFDKATRNCPSIRAKLFMDDKNGIGKLWGPVYGRRRAGRRQIWDDLAVNDLVLRKAWIVHRCWHALANRTMEWYNLRSSKDPSLKSSIGVVFCSSTVRPIMIANTWSNEYLNSVKSLTATSQRYMFLTEPPLPTQLVVSADHGVCGWASAIVEVAGSATIGELLNIVSLLRSGFGRAVHWRRGARKWPRRTKMKHLVDASPDEAKLLLLIVSRPKYILRDGHGDGRVRERGSTPALPFCRNMENMIKTYAAGSSTESWYSPGPCKYYLDDGEDIPYCMSGH